MASYFASASLIDDIKLQIEARNKEIKRLEDTVKAYKENIFIKENEAATLKKQISAIDLTIKRLTTTIQITGVRIDRTKLQIEEIKQEILAKELSINKMRLELGRLLTAAFRNDQEGAFIALMKYRSLSQLFGSAYQLREVEENIQNRLDTLRILKRDLDTSQKATEGKQRELANLSQSLRDQTEIQKDQKITRTTLLIETKNQERKFQQLLETTEAQQQAIQKDIEQLEEKLRQAVDPNSLPTKMAGVLQWPMEGTVSQGYGKTAFARWSDFYSFHNGIDIRAPLGTEIVAAERGKVIAIGDSDQYCRRGAYGKYVLISHGNNLATLYAHLSLISAASGHEVERGERIGYVGTTGLSTGPHLHFTVYDSRTVAVRQSRVCGLLPYGGSVNPLDYL